MPSTDSKPTLFARHVGAPRVTRALRLVDRDWTGMGSYYKDVERTSLLDADEAMALAREIADAREALTGLVSRIPTRFRPRILRCASELAWTFGEVQRVVGRLLQCAGQTGDRRLTALAREAERQETRFRQARDTLIKANLRLVIHVVRKFRPEGVAMMDLIQEGNIGLMRAVEKFDHERGNRFSTYAYWWIKQAVERAITDKGRTIRIPVHVRERRKRVARARQRLTSDLMREPTDAEIALELGVPLDAVENALSVVPEPGPLERPDEDRGTPAPLGILAAPVDAGPLEVAWRRELRERLAPALKQSLSRREEKIIRLRFGLGRAAAHTLEEIGALMNLSRERVRQIQNDALEKLRTAAECRVLQESSRRSPLRTSRDADRWRAVPKRTRKAS